MGTIIGMIEPDKVAFSVKMTALNGIYRKPPAGEHYKPR